jgi:hypothetical protein
MSKKEITVSRVNPLIRVPAVLFKGIDKRKRKIPLTITSEETKITIELSQSKENI